jgi:hypothetical protein
MMSRAPLLTDDQYAIFRAQTAQMIAADLYAGDLRIGVLDALSSVPINQPARKYFGDTFAQTNSLDSRDIPTLIAMGQVMKRWSDSALYESMLAALAEPSTAVRAELVLRAGGADVPWTLSADSRKVYAAWWKKNREALTTHKPPADGWRSMRPQYLPKPLALAEINPDDKRWRSELELGSLGLKNFDFAVSIDCSRSMGAEIDRLKRDLRIMYAALSAVSVEARIGITQFAPENNIKTIPLTGNIKELSDKAAKIDIFGPAGEEDWAGGVERTIADSKWSPVAERNRRAIVVISDEPITPDQHEKLMKVAKKAKDEHFVLYAVIVRPQNNLETDPLKPHERGDMDAANEVLAGLRPRAVLNNPRLAGFLHYRDFTTLTGGAASACKVLPDGVGLGEMPSGASGALIAPIDQGGGPNVRLLTRVLTDAINPQFADRVEPLVTILLQASQKAAPRIIEKRSGFGAGLPATFPETGRRRLN